VTETVPVPALAFDDFDPSVRVQDDLFRHVNGTWLATAEIPDDKPLAGAFMKLRDGAEAAVRDIITTVVADQPGSDAAKVADLYASFMDEEAAEAAGSTPLAPLLARVDAVSDTVDLAQLLGSFARTAVSGLIGIDTVRRSGRHRPAG
jgi:putative endopeptidase